MSTISIRPSLVPDLHLSMSYSIRLWIQSPRSRSVQRSQTVKQFVSGTDPVPRPIHVAATPLPHLCTILCSNLFITYDFSLSFSGSVVKYTSHAIVLYQLHLLYRDCGLFNPYSSRSATVLTSELIPISEVSPATLPFLSLFSDSFTVYCFVQF